MAISLASDVASKPQRTQRGYTATKKFDGASAPRGIAAHHSGKIRKQMLIGAVFMMAQPEQGSSYTSLREMLFSSANQPDVLKLFPDGMGNLEDELRRYQMLRFSSRIGFKPPYFYNRPLRERRVVSVASVSPNGKPTSRL